MQLVAITCNAVYLQFFHHKRRKQTANNEGVPKLSHHINATERCDWTPLLALQTA